VRIGILGTGVVGQTLAAKLRELGHDVVIGSRTEGEDKRPFAEAAAHGELLINATGGGNSLAALEAAGAENLSGKVLIDVSNPLDFSKGMPPTLSVCNDDSVGEQIQRAYPDAKVVKALNTVTANLMVEPSLVPGEHSLPIAGNDESAKAQVADLLVSFGWPRDAIVDLGDIGGARANEMYLPLWLRLPIARHAARQHPHRQGLDSAPP
jgi:8-hydroxy-5-deazaflavin:NADPH oxidoreductase